jgi:hypothetical protein
MGNVQAHGRRVVSIFFEEPLVSRVKRREAMRIERLLRSI